MDFCDDCGGIIVPEKEDGQTSFKCRKCGEPHESNGEDMVISEKKREEDRALIGEAGEEDTLPKIDEQCSECENEQAYWWMEQTRAADEPETRFFRCTECAHTWREYD